MDAMNDATIVQHVLSNRTNYYRILFVDRTATTDQIKVAYKKMALRCHPDKNKHSGASEAFKLVGTANTTLSDASKRRIYDMRGVEGVQRHESSGAARQHPAAAARHMYRQPNDIFEEFFAHARGMNGGGARVYEAEVNANVIMMVPLLIFLFLAILLQSSLMDPSGYQGPHSAHRASSVANTFSLTPEPAQGRVVERVTSLHGLRVKYYVHRHWADLATKGLADVRRMETEVLQRHRDSLARRCEAESLSFRARAKKGTPPTCTDYEVFRRALR
ncbi:DnaJ domain [Trypanosoma melophagium]|uniref:DnaJ domain n=1 Tax=Trypanosoma melophagium TaxID=715481 RepID=UPI003519E774|nr:DnaJ domain [Trypanosoma melophagium]